MSISLSAWAICFSSGARFRATRNPATSITPVTAPQRMVPWGLSYGQEEKATYQDDPENQGSPAAGIVDNLLGALEIPVNDQGPHVDAEAGQKAHGVHVGQDLLAAGGDENDGGKKGRVDHVDAVEGMAAVGGDEPEKAVAVGHPLDEFAGGHKRGVDGHDQGETGQGRHSNPKRQTPLIRVA